MFFDIAGLIVFDVDDSITALGDTDHRYWITGLVGNQHRGLVKAEPVGDFGTDVAQAIAWFEMQGYEFGGTGVNDQILRLEDRAGIAAGLVGGRRDRVVVFEVEKDRVGGSKIPFEIVAIIRPERAIGDVLPANFQFDGADRHPLLGRILDADLKVDGPDSVAALSKHLVNGQLIGVLIDFVGMHRGITGQHGGLGARRRAARGFDFSSRVVWSA